MSFKSDINPEFRTKFGEDIFNHKYKHEGAQTWREMAGAVVQDVCANYVDKMGKDGYKQLIQAVSEMKFIPGGRHLYYAMRPRHFFNNCMLVKGQTDTREDWAKLSHDCEASLATGAGIGCDYSVYRESGQPLKGTGGVASGPIPKMQIINEIGRNIIQGASRRSAIYASLSYKHGDIEKFLVAKDWKSHKVGNTGLSIWDIKQQDFNFPGILDMTNISVNYDTAWLMNYWKTGDVGHIFKKNVRQALSTGEPGFSFNFFNKENETLRNPCCEVVSEDYGDVCCLGSINMSKIADIEDFAKTIELSTMFLLCSTLKSELAFKEQYAVREKNRRLGLGLFGIHEWLVQRGYKYEVVGELHRWLTVYRDVSDHVARTFATALGVSVPVAVRAIAPTGSLSILAGTSSGIEPIFAVAYKRRFLKGTTWKHQYVVDGAAQDLIERYSVRPDAIESALDLASSAERRIKFQADIQDYVDQAISSTINLPAWGTKLNNEDTVEPFAKTLASYAHRLRGFTAYCDGARSGQPLTSVPYSDAIKHLGTEFDEHVELHDICDISGKGGFCGS